MTESPTSRRLSEVSYWVIDTPKGALWTAETGDVQTLDYGLDLRFDEFVIGVTWYQTRDAYALELCACSVGSKHPRAINVDASHVAPWASVVASPLRGIRMAAALRSEGAWLLQLLFDKTSVYLAAATILPDDGGVLPGTDEIIVFNSAKAAEAYTSR